MVILFAIETGGVPSMRGFTLLELMLALGLSSLLLLGLVQIVSAAGASARLQDNQARLQENARLAITVLSRAVRETGFNPQPWNDPCPFASFSCWPPSPSSSPPVVTRKKRSTVTPASTTTTRATSTSSRHGC